MTITTLELSQQQSYQQTSKQRQKVTLLAPANIAPDNMNVNQSLLLSSSNLISSRANQISPTSSEINNVTYEKPLSIKLQLMTLILERFIGRELDISAFSYFTNNEKVNNNFELINQTFSAINAELVTIGEQSFQQGDLLSVEQWTTSKQQLSYQIQGKFNINDQALSLNYNFTLSSERTSYSKIEMSAAALKDPLIVQFGAQSLGKITGQKNFLINQDNTLDKLPIFSGDVGYLVFDQNNNQQADDGSELFGPQTGQGFAELARLDSNNNGFIDAEDKDFERLYLWQPNADNSQTERWLSLQEAKIQAISLSAISTPFDFYDQQGQLQAQLRQSSFAISDEGYGRGVHQVDVRI
ncbi:MAG: hypothetical protein JKY81_12870 [Colwellia sp.]|nr:hypothetical protein [Colwellia sp.]